MLRTLVLAAFLASMLNVAPAWAAKPPPAPPPPPPGPCQSIKSPLAKAACEKCDEDGDTYVGNGGGNGECKCKHRDHDDDGFHGHGDCPVSK